MSLVSNLKLIRTCTTLELSQKVEKGVLLLPIPLLLVPRPRPARFLVTLGQNPCLPYIEKKCNFEKHPSKNQRIHNLEFFN